MASGSPATAGPLHWAALGCFALSIVLGISAVKLAAGPVPIRSLILLVALGLLAVGDWPIVARALRETRALLGVIAFVAVLGAVVSLLAASPFPAWSMQLAEIHFQSAVMLVVAYALVLIFGPAPVLYAFFVAYAITAVFAIGQVAGIGPAWQARITLDAVMGSSKEMFYDGQARAMGLSFTPVHFGTQTCIALAAFFYLRLATGRTRYRELDWWIVGAGVGAMLFAAAAGNRSPMLGLVVFLLLYVAICAPRLLLITLPAALVALVGLYFAADLLAGTDVRVLRSDSSASNRTTLTRFGLFLIAERPIGYGLNFQSVSHWQSFSQLAHYMPNPNAIRLWALHNYYVTVVAKYGVLLVTALALVLPRSKAAAFLWLPFVAYGVHVYFHNEGPLQGDFLVFGVIPVGLYLLKERARWFGSSPVRSARSWRRAFDEAPPARATALAR